MSAAQDFFENADECFDWAKTAKTERERRIFLQMADAWLAVARRWETKYTRSTTAPPGTKEGAELIPSSGGCSLKQA